MRRRYLITLLIGVLFVGLVAWLMTHGGRQTEKGEIFRLQLTQVSEIQVHSEHYDYTLKRQEDDWWLSEPFRGLTDPDQVEPIVRAVAALKPLHRPDKDPQDPQFGLQEPIMTVIARYKGDRTATIRLGKQSKLGSKFFADLSGQPGLFIIDQTFKSTLDKDPEELREKKLARLRTEKVKRITLQRPEETIVVERVPLTKESTWRIEAPRRLPADKWTVENLANTTKNTEALEYLPYTSENLAACGLDKPQVTVTYYQQEGEPLTVYVGKQEERETKSEYAQQPAPQQVTYAVRAGRQEILIVAAALFNDLNKSLLDLRDKHLFDLEKDQIASLKVQREAGLNFEAMKVGQKWQVTAPRTGEANREKIDDILYGITGLQALEYVVEDDPSVDLGQYGLRVPHVAVIVGVEDGDSFTLAIGKQVPDQTARYYARTSLHNDVYQISKVLLKDLPEGLDDLLQPEAEEKPDWGSAAPGPGPVPGG